MPISAESAIKELLPRALGDPELAPKLDEHQLSDLDVRQVLTEHASELAAAIDQAQQEWDEATATRERAELQLAEYRAQPDWRRARLALMRRLAPLAPFTSQNPRPDPSELTAILREAAARESELQDAWWDSAYTNWVRRQVNALINDCEDASYRSKLPAVPGSGLAEVFHPEYEVQTEVGTRLSDLFTHMPGGSIGLCGFRGSGKTTLIRSLCQTRRISAAGAPSFGFVVSAPVRYEPRDFVLYLFARLCQEILDIPPGREPPPPASATAKISAPWALLAGFVALAAAGVELAVVVSGVDFGHQLRTIMGNFGVRIAAGAVLAVAGLALLLLGYMRTLPWLRDRRARRHFEPDSPDTDEVLYPYSPDTGNSYGPYMGSVPYLAQRWLTEIRYQLTYTSGWSGSLNVSAAQVSANRSTQVEERQRTLPNVIAGYRDLAEEVSRRGFRLFIGIDELDKIGSDEDAERFLNEIKAIFGIDGCFYLVSVSENAMSSFERRGLPFRDVFDSTFDEVVRIERFTYTQSRKLIKRRTIMPEPFIALCHCVSGGLPRDLIRTARTLYRLNAELDLGGSLTDITRALITEDLRAKAAASWVAFARITAEPEATLFKSWFKRVTAPPTNRDRQKHEYPHFWLVDGDAVYQTCRDFWTEARKWPNASSASGQDGDGSPAGTEFSQRALLNSLGLEINAYRYLAASIVQFFGSQPSDSDLRAASDPMAGEASFEMLAEARLLFVNSPLLSWGMISDFRKAHKMKALDQPDPCWLGATDGVSPGGAADRDFTDTAHRPRGQTDNLRDTQDPMRLGAGDTPT